MLKLKEKPRKLLFWNSLQFATKYSYLQDNAVQSINNSEKESRGNGDGVSFPPEYLNGPTWGLALFR